MTKTEYEILQYIDEDVNLITLFDLQNKEDRILISGYTADRSTFITELINGEIETYILSYISEKREYVDVEDNRDYVPTKRVYPAQSDYEFCKLLQERGATISFTYFE